MKRLNATILCAVLAAAVPGFSDGPQPPTIGLHAVQALTGVIGSEEREAGRAATVDDARSLGLVMTSTEDLTLTIALPDGSTLSAEKGTSDDRQWYAFNGNGETLGEALPGIGSGYNTVVQIQKPPRGAYKLRLERTRDSGEPAPFAITLIEDSDLRMGLWLQSSRVLRGTPVAVAAVIADAGQPAREAEVQARFTREIKEDALEPSGECAMRDDGQAPDVKEGDGVYTGLFVPPAEGRFWVAVRAVGRTQAGARFERDGGLFLLASEPAVEVRVEKEPYWTRNELGAINRLIVPIGLEGRAGTYDVLVELRAPNGRSVTANRTIHLKSRAQTTVAFGSEVLKPLAADGSYSIDAIEVAEISKDGRVVRARTSGAGRTPFLPMVELE
jgi:hypothetical protein